MNLIEVITLALIQGVTEFLPISSSAHLLLPKLMLGWQDQGLAFDVAVHFGSLLAVLFYYRTQIQELLMGSITIIKGSPSSDGVLALKLVVATIPAAFLGLLFADFIEQNLRTTAIIAVTTFIGALLLWYADKKPSQYTSMQQIGWLAVLLIGIAQATALVPGTSRSGITLTMALLLGYNRNTAANFSFLMAIPIITASALFQSWELLTSQKYVPWMFILLATVISALSAFTCIHYFLKFISRSSLLPFVVYRICLALILLCMLYIGSINI